MTYKAIFLSVAIAGVALVATADGKKQDSVGAANAAALKALEGVASYSHKSPYSEAISDVYLGYDAEGKVRVAVALRYFKTYERVTAMAVITEQDGQYVVTKAEIPDAEAIGAEDKRKKVLDAIQGIAGKVIKDKDGALHAIDAVTGATRYQSRIFSTFDVLAKTAIEEMQKNPDWPKTPVGK